MTSLPLNVAYSSVRTVTTPMKIEFASQPNKHQIAGILKKITNRILTDSKV